MKEEGTPDSVSLKSPNVDCKMNAMNHYTLLAEMFRYPYPGQDALSESWEQVVSDYGMEITQSLSGFISHVRHKPLSVQQEYYISTFDIQALCYLDIGYVLYGEDYKRGVFLANLKKEQEIAGNECGSELPDHLPNILTLLPKLSDVKLAEELVYSLMIPALHKMIASFRTNDNVYKETLRILVKIMETDFPESEFERFNFLSTNDKVFLKCPMNDEDSPQHA